MPDLAYNRPPRKKPEDGYYGRTDCIGSSILGAYIDDSGKAHLEVAKTNSIEPGHIWEDLLEERITGRKFFDEKYFESSVSEFPTAKDRRTIPDIMEEQDLKLWIEQSIIKKADGKPKKSNYNEILFEIKDNGYRRPVPAQLLRNMEDAWENFQKYVFNDKDHLCRVNLVELLSGAKWQYEHFWEENEIKCRQKLDTWAACMTRNGRLDIPVDIKWTACIKQFRQNWKRKLVHQAIHYEYGFRDLLLRQEGVHFDGVMYFVVAENKPPFTIYGFWLTEDDYLRNAGLYYRYLSDCWDWIQAGKPSPGWVEMQPLDRYARPVHKKI